LGKRIFSPRARIVCPVLARHRIYRLFRRRNDLRPYRALMQQMHRDLRSTPTGSLLRSCKMTIRKVKAGYRLVSKKGKNLGTYKNKAGAKKRERQVQYFKSKKRK
jgi:hypothetical protein